MNIIIIQSDCGGMQAARDCIVHVLLVGRFRFGRTWLDGTPDIYYLYNRMPERKQVLHEFMQATQALVSVIVNQSKMIELSL